MMIDVDQFKAYNDTYGHPAGNDVLRELSNRLRSSVRNHDILARYGGEEFAVLLPDTNLEASRILGERLRVAIERNAWPLRPITISLGASTMTPRTPRAAVLIEQADRSLYQSKAEGRNRMTHACELPADFADRRAVTPLVEEPEMHPEVSESNHSTA
jgi:diguanylate cyclase (GGDEF)-like protein